MNRQCLVQYLLSSLTSLISLSTSKNSSLEERERDWSRNVSNFIALIPSRSVPSNVGKFRALNYKRLNQSSGKEKRMSSCVHVLHKTSREIGHCNVAVEQ